MEKRISSRAIIFVGDKIVSMYREKFGRKYYTFPGGKQEEGETEKECVKREVFEEFGLVVRPIKKVYVYESDKSIENFYVCIWESGDFGSGHGEEFLPGQTKGVYKPVQIEIAQIPNLLLMPPEVAAELFNDYAKNGEELTKFVKKLYGEIK